MKRLLQLVLLVLTAATFAHAQAGSVQLIDGSGNPVGVTGGALNLRRSDLRTFVGAGAGAGIAAAFGAPITGAFYAFEIVIGAYTPSAIAPVAAAALEIAQWFSGNEIVG